MRQAGLAVALAALACLAASPGNSGAQEGALHVSSALTYNVKTADAGVTVEWDVSLTNNDSATQDNGSGATFSYESLSLPVLKGASDATAFDSEGAALDVEMQDAGPGVAQRATAKFARRLFFGDTYQFRLTYRITEARFPGVLVTQNYAFLPAIAAGDEAIVTVNTPAGGPWEISLEEQQCPRNGDQFTCSDGDGAYLAALVEVSQPAATTDTSFQVQMEKTLLDVNLTYFRGEDAAAAHQQELVSAGLPLIEQAYGFAYDGPAVLNISHGGRQTVLGYEGLAGCSPDVSCDIVISPIADDYTVLHELSHMWSPIYAKRWLSEGFAQLITEEAAPQMPTGLVSGAPPQRLPSSMPLQLDEWGEVTSVIGASESDVASIEAGYDYSLRFLHELQQDFGMDTLKRVNRNIAGSGEAADSRRFMDVLEEATGRNLDALFLLWVFPDSWEQTLTDRRQALDRVAVLRTRLADEELPADRLADIQAQIHAWDFATALTKLDEVETELEAYAELRPKLSTLERNASAAGLTLPGDIDEALRRFDFTAAQSLIISAHEAIGAYLSATDRVDDPVSLWQQFGLLGSDPDGEVRVAANAFAAGEFGYSEERSNAAVEMIDDASSIALRRLLLVGGFLALVAIAIGVAIVVGQFRQRGIADPRR